MENKKQAIEIADIFRDYKHDFLSHHTICAVQQKALEDIIACRTSELGGILCIAIIAPTKFNPTIRVVIGIAPNVST